jgi:hypothetical protein
LTLLPGKIADHASAFCLSITITYLNTCSVFPNFYNLAFSGSPALTHSRNENLYSLKFSLINIRNAVGGAQRVVTYDPG